MPRSASILAALKSMPPLPEVAYRLLATMNDPEYDIDDVVDLVRVDPTLTARLLRLVNSALFGNMRPITTVGDAVTFAGTRNLVKLVMVSCTATQFADTGSSTYADSRSLWHHTVACALAAQHLAERVCANGSVAFTIGVLHNVGRIAMSRFAADWNPAAAAAAGLPPDLLHVERFCFGIDHAKAAGIVASAWNLPQELAEPLSKHHDQDAETVLGAVLDIADTMALSLGLGNPLAPRQPTPRPSALRLLEFGDADLQAANTHLIAEMKRNEELLNLDALLGR